MLGLLCLTAPNERFNGTLRKEVLNAEWFHTTRQAQVAINVWLRQYNRIRPHHALNMTPPAPETLLEKPKISGQYRGLDRGGAKNSNASVASYPALAFY